MPLSLLNATALITGAGSGISLAFTKILLSKGCNVLIADLSLLPEAEALVTSHPPPKHGRAVFKKTDVTDWAQLQFTFDTVVFEFGGLDIVCPGAGVFEPAWSNFWHLKDTLNTTTTNAYKTLEINLTHPIRCTQLAISTFKRLNHNHGTVLLISSSAAQMALLPAPLYAASKAGISSFARSLGYLDTLHEQESGRPRVRVVAVAPGCVKTPIWTEEKLEWVDEEKDSWIPVEGLAEVMCGLVEGDEYPGGTVLEVGVDGTRKVEMLMDPGPGSDLGRGFTVGKMVETGFEDVFGLLEREFGGALDREV